MNSNSKNFDFNKTVTQSCIGLLGGTFDPVHLGHIQIAQACLTHLPLQQIRFIPCQQPVHKAKPQASSQQRYEMLEIALAPYPNFVLDRCELERASASYTLDTLSYFRAELPSIHLCWILGSDAFLNFMQWHAWRKILQLAHLIVVMRPNYALPSDSPITELVNERSIAEAKLLSETPAGGIFVLRLAPLTVASRDIREQIHYGTVPENSLPKGVWEYIQTHKLYL